MADVTINAGVDGLTENRDALHGPYWTSPSVGYVVFQVASNAIEIEKTADSGAAWTIQDATGNPASINNRSMAVWWDQETPGNSGTLIHIAWVETTSNEVHYIAFDTSDNTYGTDRTIDALTISGTSSDSDVGITVSKSGRVYVCARGDFEQDTENTDHSMRSSSDGFATNNESELSPYSSAEEVVKLFPGADADENDISAVVYVSVGLSLEFWKFDASANTWGATTIDNDSSYTVTSTEARLYKIIADAAVQLSDEHIIVAWWSDLDTSTGDLRCADIDQATPTVTAKTNIDTNTDDSAQVALLINQQNNDWYAAYLGSDAGDETWGVTVVCYFKKSDDGGSTWSAEQTYGVQLDDLRAVSLGRTVGDAGGRVMPVWFNDDLEDILVNDGNDIEIAAASVGGVGIRNPMAGPMTLRTPMGVS